MVYPPGYLHPDASIGDGTMIGAMHHIDNNVTIGKDCRIQGQVYICPCVTIGDGVFIGPGVIFTNDPYPRSGKRAKTVVEDNVIIGAGAIIGAGVRISEDSVIGMGAVVTKDTVPGGVYYGNPAKWRGNRHDYDKKQAAWKNL